MWYKYNKGKNADKRYLLSHSGTWWDHNQNPEWLAVYQSGNL